MNEELYWSATAYAGRCVRRLRQTSDDIERRIGRGAPASPAVGSTGPPFVRHVAIPRHGRALIELRIPVARGTAQTRRFDVVMTPVVGTRTTAEAGRQGSRVSRCTVLHVVAPDGAGPTNALRWRGRMTNAPPAVGRRRGVIRSRVGRPGALRCARLASDACSHTTLCAIRLRGTRSRRPDKSCIEPLAHAAPRRGTANAARGLHESVTWWLHEDSVVLRVTSRGTKRQIAPPRFSRRMIPSGLSEQAMHQHRHGFTREHRDATPRAHECIGAPVVCQAACSTADDRQRQAAPRRRPQTSSRHSFAPAGLGDARHARARRTASPRRE
jgi:hypothetical protein